jgi:carboxylate-amine ligase
MRPQLCDILPRQGVPPAIGSWDELAAAFAWARRAGRMADPSQWWYEARLHPRLGRSRSACPTARPRSARARRLPRSSTRSSGGWSSATTPASRFATPATWRIAENRWSACRHGLDGTLADLETGEPRPTRERLGHLLDDLEPAARRLGCTAGLAAARELARDNGAQRQRAVAAERGVIGLAAWLADRFLG